jgi:aryl-phospho-beta-D-glucosidase BglC (GH1 family)
MKKFLIKAKTVFKDVQDRTSPQLPPPPIQENQPSQIKPPSSVDIFRYRYAHGTNLGSIFVLEKWLSGSMFSGNAKGDSELDAVTASLKESGQEATRKKWELHWQSAISDQDFQWLAQEAKCNSIRLPIGYFTLGEEWCKNSPFSNAGAVYANAWAAVQQLEKRARIWGIGILLDFHALYGGANGEAHSGNSSEKAGLWTNTQNRERSAKALAFIAQQVKNNGMEGVVGIQICNEAIHDAKDLYEWYDKVIQGIGSVDESMPIYISDAWDLNRTLQWTNKRQIFRQRPSNPIVIDTHRYYTFNEADRAQTPQQIISRIPYELSELDGKESDITTRGESQLIVGEWSCALDGQTWSRVPKSEKDKLVTQFGRSQGQRWQHRAGGAYFWTYKMDWMDGGDWGFVEQTKKSNIVAPPFLTIPAREVYSRAQRAILQRQQLAQSAREAHERYWNNKSPGKTFAHQLYSEGWDVGFSDAHKFFTMRVDGGLGKKAVKEGGDKIGCLEIWAKKRLLECGQRGEFVWEWEQGFRAGVGAFYGSVGI